MTFRQTSQDEVDADGQPLNENRLLIRRARMRVTSDRGLTFAAAEIDVNTVNGPQVRPLAAEVSLKWPESRPGIDPSVDVRRLPEQTWFMVTTGLFQTPFGFEAQEFAIKRPFLEQSTMSRVLFPDQFDLGLRVVGGFKALNWALGIMNGDPIGTRTFPGRDPNESKDLMFRLGAATDVTEGVRIEGGVSGLTGRGFHRGRAATDDQLVWRDLDEDTIVDPIELQAIGGSPAEPSETFRRFAVGADLRASFALPAIGELALRGEIIRSSNLGRAIYVADPVATGRDLRELGYYVGATQEITRWAQVGVRYDRYDPDTDAREREPFAFVSRDLSLGATSVMAAVRTAYARFVVQYDHRTNALGRDPSGAPATLADDSLTLRAEARF